MGIDIQKLQRIFFLSSLWMALAFLSLFQAEIISQEGIWVNIFKESERFLTLGWLPFLALLSFDLLIHLTYSASDNKGSRRRMEWFYGIFTLLIFLITFLTLLEIKEYTTFWLIVIMLGSFTLKILASITDSNNKVLGKKFKTIKLSSHA